MSESLQILDNHWQWHRFSEATLLLKSETATLDEIHALYRILSDHPPKGIIEILQAMESIAIVFDPDFITPQHIFSWLMSLSTEKKKISVKTQKHIIPVCYEMGKDLDKIAEYLNLSSDEIIKIHSDVDYTLAMIGFLPGFMYLSGLSEKLHVPRKSNPDISVDAGSVGIGGSQTGMYSLSSPGGWNIIGLSPISLFESSKTPPMIVQPGDTVRFQPISSQEFEELKP